MQYIQELLDLTQNYWVLATIIGLLSAFIESFIPALPLVAIVTANAAIQGLFIGCLLSWIGSGLGTTSLFLLISRFNDSKLFNKLRNSKTEKAISWMDKQGFKLLFIAYACPFMPGCLVTIASAFCKKDLKDFVPAMLAGKFVMFIVISYVASDIEGFITSPLKIASFILLVFLSWKIGNRVNKNLENHNYDFHHKKHHNDKDDKMI